MKLLIMPKIQQKIYKTFCFMASDLNIDQIVHVRTGKQFDGSIEKDFITSLKVKILLQNI